MVVTHILHKLVCSTRFCFYLNMATKGFCVLEVDFSGEPAIRLEETVCNFLCISGNKFVAGRPTSKEEAVGLSTGAPMEIPSRL